MGQLTSKDDSTLFKELESNYTFVNSINDVRYGTGKLYQLKTNPKIQILHKDINVTDQTQFEYWQKKLNDRNSLKHPNIIEMKQHSLQQEDQMCSTYFRVHIIFEYLPLTLKEAIQQRKLLGTYYEENEILNMLKGAVSGLARMQELKVPHQNIRHSTLSYNNGIIKVCDTPLLTNTTAFSAVLQDYNNQQKGYYLSPILTKAVHQNNHQPQHNLYKSDVYTLGMNMLGVCLLQQCDQFYRYDQGTINQQDIQIQLEQAKQNYTSELMDKIEEMLIEREGDRPDFLQLNNQLKQTNINYNVQLQPQEDYAEPPQISPSRSKHYVEQSRKSEDYDQFTEQQHFQDYSQKPQIQQTYGENQKNLQTYDMEKYSDQIGPHLLNEDQLDQIYYCEENQPSKSSKNDILINNERQSYSPMKDMRYSAPSVKNSVKQQKAQDNHFQSQFNDFYDQVGQLTQIESNPQQHQQQQYQQQKQQQQQQQIPQKHDAFTQSSLIFQQTDILKQSNQISRFQQAPQKQSQEIFQSLNNIDPYQDFKKYNTYQKPVTSYQPPQQQQQLITKYQEQQQVVPNYYTQYQSSSIAPIQPEQYSQLIQKQSSYQSYQPQHQQQPQPQYQSTYVRNPIDIDSIYKFTQPADLNKVPELTSLARTSNFGNNKTYADDLLPSGERYVGEKVNGKRQGKGKVYYKEGGYYDGYWSNDMINGKGVLYYASGHPAYDGDWVDDKFEGKGILYNDTPKFITIHHQDLNCIDDGWTKYVGSFYDDCKHGPGVLHFFNGDQFEGQFENDNAQGRGRFTYSNGQVVQGMWNGNMFFG